MNIHIYIYLKQKVTPFLPQVGGGTQDNPIPVLMVQKSGEKTTWDV